MLTQQIIQGLAIGSVYGVIALAFVLIYNAMGVLNFAQGEIFMAGAFAGLFFHVILGWPFIVAFPLAILAGGLLGWLIERIAFRPLFNAPEINILIATIGMSIFLRNLFRVFFGADPYPFPTVFGDKPVYIGSVLLIPQNLWIAGIGLLLVVLIRLFLTQTFIGRALRAAAQDRDTAGLMGINVKSTVSWTWTLASGLGAAAGVLVAPLFFVMADMGTVMGLKGFSAAVFGGIESVTGAMAGGLILGLAESIGGGFISSGYQAAIAFGILILVLIFKPSGIMGRKL